MGWWGSLSLLIVSDLFFLKKSGTQKFENAHFSFRDKTYGDVSSRERGLNAPPLSGMKSTGERKNPKNDDTIM
jgi:hypothetical protein